MKDWEYLGFLREGDYFVPGFGVNDRGQPLVVPFQVSRTQVFDFVYDPVAQGSLGGVLAPAGASPGTGQVAAFQDNIILGLSASLTKLNGVTDIFNILLNGEVYEIVYGIAPSIARVYLKQPYNVPVTSMDQNIVPSANIPDVGYTDGFPDGSPFVHPSPATRWYAFANISANFSFYNPAPYPVNPRLNFVVNRMRVRVVKDLPTLKGLLTKSIPARWKTIGNPFINTGFSKLQYENVNPIPPSMVTASDAATLLAKEGYC